MCRMLLILHYCAVIALLVLGPLWVLQRLFLPRRTMDHLLALLLNNLILAMFGRRGRRRGASGRKYIR